MFCVDIASVFMLRLNDDGVDTADEGGIWSVGLLLVTGFCFCMLCLNVGGCRQNVRLCVCTCHSTYDWGGSNDAGAIFVARRQRHRHATSTRRPRHGGNKRNAHTCTHRLTHICITHLITYTQHTHIRHGRVRVFFVAGQWWGLNFNNKNNNKNATRLNSR